jgi:hypothetical protein
VGVMTAALLTCQLVLSMGRLIDNGFFTFKIDRMKNPTNNKQTFCSANHLCKKKKPLKKEKCHMVLRTSEVALKENGDRKRLLHILIPTLESDVDLIQECPYGM